jgi:hypothetical protein
MDTYREILKNVYLGSSHMLEIRHPFRLIVNCSVDIPFPNYISDNQKIRIPIEDDLRDTVKFVEMIVYTRVLEKIHNCILNNDSVFIYSGQRSYIVFACFLIKYYHISPRDAMKYIIQKMETYMNMIIVEEKSFSCTLTIFYHYLKHKKKEKDCQKIDEIKTKNVNITPYET